MVAIETRRSLLDDLIGDLRPKNELQLSGKSLSSYESATRTASLIYEVPAPLCRFQLVSAILSSCIITILYMAGRPHP